MTKEEAKEYLDNYRKMYAALAPERFLEALDIMLNEPPLPPNLDEAAEKYEHNPGYYECTNRWPSVAFKAGAKWMANEFENNRLKACEALSEEDYKLESDFVDAHIKKNHCIPTFLDAIKYGVERMAEQGEIFEGIFKAGDPGYPDVHIGEQYSIENIEHKPDGITPGDEVIVQIRKKQ